MRGVVFVSTMGGIPWAGSEELWAGAAMHLRRCGVPVAMCVKRWLPDPPQLATLVEAGCTVFRRRCIGRSGRFVNRICGDPVVRWLRQFSDRLVVISQSCLDGTEWALRCKTLGIDYAMLFQVAAEFFWPNDDDAEAAQEALTNARKCFFVSQGNADLISRQLAIELPNAGIVANPFNVPYDAAPEWPDDSEHLKIACVARLDARHKGQDLLLEVLRSPRWRERSISLTLFGEGPNERTFRKFVSDHKLNNVVFGGFCSNIERIWASHHALVLPSRVEGQPLVVIEAMLCGRACVVTNVAGNGEIVTDGQTGFVAAAPTVELLDEAMERMWQSRADLRTMGQAARRSIRERVPEDAGAAFADELMRLSQPAKTLECSVPV